jgi:hypothetical protein
MDQWWNVDYAKNRCEQREHLNVPQCDGDPTSEVKDYQRQIATAFAANPTCHGFRMIGAIERFNSEDLLASQWQLMLDYEPGASKQSWSVVKQKSLAVVAEGTDGPKETVSTLCAILSHKGGSAE